MGLIEYFTPGFRERRQASKRHVVWAINVVLAQILMLMLVSSDARTESLFQDKEVYCKVHHMIILSKTPEGEPDTFQLYIGCTSLNDKQELMKLNLSDIDSSELKSLFRKHHEPMRDQP